MNINVKFFRDFSGDTSQKFIRDLSGDTSPLTGGESCHNAGGIIGLNIQEFHFNNQNLKTKFGDIKAKMVEMVGIDKDKENYSIQNKNGYDYDEDSILETDFYDQLMHMEIHPKLKLNVKKEGEDKTETIIVTSKEAICKVLDKIQKLFGGEKTFHSVIHLNKSGSKPISRYYDNKVGNCGIRNGDTLVVPRPIN